MFKPVVSAVGQPFHAVPLSGSGVRRWNGIPDDDPTFECPVVCSDAPHDCWFASIGLQVASLIRNQLTSVPLQFNSTPTVTPPTTVVDSEPEDEPHDVIEHLIATHLRQIRHQIDSANCIYISSDSEEDDEAIHFSVPLALPPSSLVTVPVSIQSTPPRQALLPNPPQDRAILRQAMWSNLMAVQPWLHRDLNRVRRVPRRRRPHRLHRP